MQLDENSGTIAAWVAGIVTVIAGWWKARLIMRQDSRNDGESSDVHLGYRGIVRQLQAELSRVRVELEREIDARQAAEARAGVLLARVVELERRCELLGREVS